MKIEYNPYEVSVIEQIKEIIVNNELFKSKVSRENVYLFDIPEESRRDELLVRLNYITMYETIFYSNKSHGEGFTIQVDIWDSKKHPIGLGNLVRDILGEYEFYQLNATFDESDEDGSYRDSRRYEGVLNKVKP